jgi:hypothetical protein
MRQLSLEFVRTLSATEVKSLKKKGGYYSKDSIYFTCKALVNDIVPSAVISEYYWTFEGKELRWRHESPDENIDMLIGHVHKSWVENGELYLMAEVWGYDLRPELANVREAVSTGLLSISVGMKETYGDNSELIAIYGRELSLTPNPACTADMGCGILEVIATFEKGERKSMPDDKAIEILQKQIAANEELIKNLEKGAQATNKVVMEQNVELEKTVQILSDKVKAANKTIGEQNIQLEDYKKENAELKKNAEKSKTLEVRKSIVNHLKLTEEKAVSEKLAELEQYDEKLLNQMDGDFKRISEINEKAGRSKGNRPEIKNDLQNNDDPIADTNLSDVEYALKMNPSLAKRLGQKGEKK